MFIPNYHKYTRPNVKLPSLKLSISGPNTKRAGGKCICRFNQQSEFRFWPAATERKLNKKLKQKNTKKATEWQLKKFDKWCEKGAIKIDLKTIALKELDEILRSFTQN